MYRYKSSSNKTYLLGRNKTQKSEFLERQTFQTVITVGRPQTENGFFLPTSLFCKTEMSINFVMH